MAAITAFFSPYIIRAKRTAARDAWSRAASSDRTKGAKWRKTTVCGQIWGFVGAFGVLYVSAVVRLPLWGEKSGFKGVLWVGG
jgi:hypothetical protein